MVNVFYSQHKLHMDHYVNELKSGVKYSLTMWTSRYTGDVNG